MQYFDVIDDSAMEQVKGGLSFSIGFDTKAGLSVDSPLGKVEIASPITLATDVFKTLGGAVGGLLETVGNKLTQLGQLFDFS